MQKGPPEHFFSASNPVENGEAEAAAKDIALVHVQGLEEDNNNKPAPKNVPEETGVCDRSGLVWANGQKWGWDGNEQKLRCPSNPDPGFSKSWSPLGKTSLEILCCCFL